MTVQPVNPKTPELLPEQDRHLSELEQKLRDAQQFRTLDEKVQDLKDEGKPVAKPYDDDE